MRREIADVLETVKRAKDRDKGCTLLIGAGCSVKAGIPMASEFVEIIRKEYPRAYERAPEKSYPHVMAELLMAERRDLISNYINNAKINWAHLAIAQLLKHGFVDRVLTVNFDPLVMRACALVGVFPAVYDFAASQIFKPDFIAQQSIFHLHGQHTGLVVLNTETEVERLSQHLGPVFSDSVRGRVWIVAGYSGENDPVFEHLAKTERYDNGLYWICYKDNPPKAHVQEKLLVDGKDCFCIQGFDADDFFVALAQGLGCFPPAFVQTPFTHLENLLEPVLPYTLPGNDSNLEAIPKKFLRDAIEKIEKPGSLVLRAWDLLLTGNFNAVIEMETELAKTRTDDLADVIAWGYVSAGNESVAKAQSQSGTEADRLWKLAGEKYEAALKINPEKSEAFYNWGSALDDQARTKSGEEADRLWALASEKYDAALRIKPDYHEALYNWGTVLNAQAATKTGDEADRLLALAGEKYKESVNIKKDYPEALYNWGCVLSSQALTRTGDEAERLWLLAIEKYAATVKIDPNKYEALYNWANALDDQARSKSGDEADRLWVLAGEKYDAVLKINGTYHQALNNWAGTLINRARTKSGDEADRLWALASEKYEEVLQVKPDYHRALYNWAIALAAQAETKTGDEAERLRELANEKLAAARALAPELYTVNTENPEVESNVKDTPRRRKKKKS
jgi:hypothetical protein